MDSIAKTIANEILSDDEFVKEITDRSNIEKIKNDLWLDIIEYKDQINKKLSEHQNTPKEVVVVRETPSIPEINLGSVHHRQKELLSYASIRLPVYLHGPTGSGKTKAAALVAKGLNLPFYKKLMGNQMTESSIIGYMFGNRYVEGIAYKPYTEGGVLLLDELDNGNGNTNLVANGLSDESFAFPCGMKERHKDFIMIATANTLGNGATKTYVGRNPIDKALLNRFVFMEWDYDRVFANDLAVKEYLSWGGTDREDFNKVMVSFWKFVDSIDELNMSHVLSQRNLLQIARAYARGVTKKEILHSIILRGLEVSQAEKLLNKAKTTRPSDSLVKHGKDIMDAEIVAPF